MSSSLRRRCDACGFDWVMQWVEDVTYVYAPELFTGPGFLWEPYTLRLKRELCTRCGFGGLDDGPS